MKRPSVTAVQYDVLRGLVRMDLDGDLTVPARCYRVTFFDHRKAHVSKYWALERDVRIERRDIDVATPGMPRRMAVLAAVVAKGCRTWQTPAIERLQKFGLVSKPLVSHEGNPQQVADYVELRRPGLDHVYDEQKRLAKRGLDYAVFINDYASLCNLYRQCQVCGCMQHMACWDTKTDNPCSWASEDPPVCSPCARKSGIAP